MTVNDRVIQDVTPPPAVERELLAQFGEVLHGRELAPLLGFRTARSFARVADAGQLPVRVFRMAGRRGWFARTREVAAWLSGANPSLEPTDKGVARPDS